MLCYWITPLSEINASVNLEITAVREDVSSANSGLSTQKYTNSVPTEGHDKMGNQENIFFIGESTDIINTKNLM